MHKPPIYNAAHILDRAAWANPERVNLAYGEKTWTLDESARVTRRIAQLLAQGGVSKGDRVVMISHNSPYHLFIFIACARLGAVFVPLSYRLTNPELQAAIDFTSPRVVIADADVAGRSILTYVGTTVGFVIDDDPASGPLGPALENGYFALTAALEIFDGDLIADGTRGNMPELNQQGYPQGTAAIFFTSGSGGARVRAVELTHENLWWGARNFQDGFRCGGEDTVLVACPMYHIGGFNGGTLDQFTSGGRVIIMRSFEPAEVLRLIEEEKVSIFFGVPTMYHLLLNEPEIAQRNLASLTKAVIGGTAVSPDLLARLEEAGIRAANVWGTTETSGTGIYQPYGRGVRGSIGRPFAYVEARILNLETGEDDVEGELLVRGPSVSPGYWHDDELNRQAYVDGWLRTGDIVRADGELTVIGKRGERITTGGEGVDPVEVEAVLREYPGIEDVVVVGIPNEVWGQEVAAVIVCADDAVPALVDVQAFASQMLAGYKLPRRLARIAQVPRTEDGQPIRRSVREELLRVYAPAGQ